MFLWQFRAGGEAHKGPVVTAQEAQAQAILTQARVCTLVHVAHDYYYFIFWGWNECVRCRECIWASLKGLLKLRQVYSSHNTVWYMEMSKLPVTQLMYSTAVNVRFANFYFWPFTLSLQLTMRGVPGPMGLTGRSGPVVSVPFLSDF